MDWSHTLTNHRWKYSNIKINYLYSSHANMIKEKKIKFCLSVFFLVQTISNYCNIDVRPNSFKVLSTVAWLGALRIWTFGGGTGIAGNTLVKCVIYKI